MRIMPFLWRNIKWRFHHKFTIFITILQPILWLVLYSSVANSSMRGIGIENYTAFILPGIILLVSFSSCSSSGMMNYLMKTDQSFYRILIAPVPRTSILLGQILEAVLCTFLEVGILCIVSLFFSVSIAFHNIIWIVIVVFMNSFFMAGIAYAISLSLPNEVVYETIMNAIILPIFFLSTALFPADTLTKGLKIAVNLNPLTPIINILRSLILGEAISFKNILFIAIFQAFLCSISFLWAFYRLKKETDL